MNETHVYIGNSILDISPGQVMAISIKKIEIADLPKRFVNYTNQIKLLPTENNLILTGFANSERSQSSIPYSINNGKVIQNGIETIKNASIILNSSNDDEISINIYETFYDFFAAIKGLNISDINPIANSAWEATDIDDARTNTSGIVSVVINWGIGSPIYDVNYFLPCFHYHTIITSILQYTGLTLSGDILTDARFTDLVIPYPGEKFEYKESEISGLDAMGTSPGQAVGSPSIAVGILCQFSANYGNIVSNAYLATTDHINSTVYADIDVSSIIWGTATLTFARIIRLRGGSETTLATSSNIVNPAGSGSFTFNTGSILLEEGDQVYVKFFSDATITLTVAYAVDTTSTLVVTSSTTVNRTNVNWNSLWPEIPCIDLVHDFFNRFSIIPKLIENTLYLKSIQDIIEDRAGAIDWSGKLVKSNPNISFGTTYAQENLFSYVDSELVNDKTLGEGSIDLDNSTIEVSNTVFTSLFENCKTELVGNYYTANMQVFDATSADITDFINPPSLTLLTKRDKASAEGAITFYAVGRTDYKVGYFVDPSQSKDSGWEYFLGEFYSGLESALQKNKIVTKQYYLNELDIANYDPHKMVYDGEGYYIVNAIRNFIPGNITKVELFKVS